MTGVGLWRRLAAALIVGALAGWREWSRRRRAAGVARPGRRGAAARGCAGWCGCCCSPSAAGSATASVIGLTGAGSDGHRAGRRAGVDPHRPRHLAQHGRHRRRAEPAGGGAGLAGAAGRSRLAPGGRAWCCSPASRSLTCPLTSDLGALRLALDEAGATQLAIPGGSVLGPAIARSVAAFGEGRARRTLIVVSDGEDTGTGVAEAAAAAKQAGVVVHTVGVGTAQGIAMPVRRPPPGRAAPPDAETRVTKLEDKGLRELADRDRRRLSRRRRRSLAGAARRPPARARGRPSSRRRRSGGRRCCSPRSSAWRSSGCGPSAAPRVAAATVAVAARAAGAGAGAAADGWDAIREGNAALDRGRTREAIAAYRRAAQDADAAAIAWFNVGVALAKQDDPKNAAMAFARSAAFYKTDGERGRAHYNRGIMLERTEELEESARAFIAALRARLRRTTTPAINLAIIRARLERDRSKDPPPPSPQDDLEKALQQVPQQSYAFTKGKKQQRPVTAGSDW